VRVSASADPWDQPAVASCGFVVAFDRFEQEALRPLARRYFGQELKAIDDIGVYSCRATRTGRESEHARGLAMDIAGFDLEDGRRILVKAEWGRRDNSGAFLRAVAGAACRYFNVVLTPDSDRDHLDHIHIDLGPYKLCVTR